MSKAASQNHCITRGQDFRLPFRFKPRGALVDTTLADIKFILEDGPTWANATGGGTEITQLLANSQPSTAITGAFTATGIVIASGAAFADNRVSLFDLADITGTAGGTNDATDLPILSLTSNTEIVLDNTFTPAVASGAIVCKRGDEWWELFLDDAVTLILALGRFEYHLRFEIGDVFIPATGVFDIVDPRP